MTPEKARALLEAATPGPWERHPDNPRMLCNLDRKFAVHAELVKNRGLEPDPEDVANTELIAAAPELAELVAGLRYEYAVQVPVNGHWEYTKDDQYGPEVSRNHRDATWYSSRRAAAIWADLWDDGEEAPRVVRRLVGDPEVVPDV